MPDLWATFATLDPTTQQRLADVLETRGAEPQQQAMRQTFLADIPLPAAAHVLEVGCGTGVLTRRLACLPGVATVVGVDPAPLLLERARELAAHLQNVTFQEGDGRALPFADGSFDVVVFDSTLSHVPEPLDVLVEAHRVTRCDGWLAVFDGDYATTTVALGDHDPLQACVDMMMVNSVNHRWLLRRLSSLLRAAGFRPGPYRSHGFVETGSGYMLTVVDRGADLLCSSGQIGEETAAILKAEARRRVAAGAFFGHIAYGSITAHQGER